MSDLHFLVEDPRPDLTDSHLWVTLQRSVWTSGIPTRRAYDLACTLWTFRVFGIMIKRTHVESKLEPLDTVGNWENIEEYKEMAAKHLKPFWKEIKYLLDKLP